MMMMTGSFFKKARRRAELRREVALSAHIKILKNLGSPNPRALKTKPRGFELRVAAKARGAQLL